MHDLLSIIYLLYIYINCKDSSIVSAQHLQIKPNLSYSRYSKPYLSCFNQPKALLASPIMAIVFDGVIFVRPPRVNLRASMSTKRLSKSANLRKSAKKEKRCDNAAICSDLNEAAIRNGMKDAWKNRTSFSQGSYPMRG